MPRFSVRLITLVTFALVACSGDADRAMGSATTAAGTAAKRGVPAGGMVGWMGGTVANSADLAGARAAGGSGGNSSGSGGIGGASGVSGAGGIGGAAGGENTGGHGPTAGTGAQTGHCKAIGWATRSGRTGGAVDVTGGGDTMPVVVSSFDQLQTYAADGQPRVIHIDGSVGDGWSGKSGDRLNVGSNKTIVGLHPGTQLRAAIHVSESNNVIIRNLVIRGSGSNSDQAWDNLNIEGGAKNIWIDHCEFWDGQDGNADVVKGADNVTFTWNIFGYRTDGGHNFSNLVASSDDEPQSEGKLDITLMFNWFTGVAQRQPRCR